MKKNKLPMVRPKLIRSNNSGFNTVIAPAATSSNFKRSTPQFRNGNGYLEVAHTEPILLNLNGSVNWTQQVSLLLNPGNQDMFPWLAGMAPLFEFYQFADMEIIYVPAVSSATNGSVQIAPDYDASDAAPTSELIFSNYKDFSEGVCWNVVRCKIDPSSLNRFAAWKYTLGNNINVVSPSGPIYNSGNLYVYTTGMGGSSAVGKLYVRYVCRFKDPTLPPTGLPTIIGGTISGGTPTSALILAGASLQPGGDGIAVINGSKSNIYFENPGEYFIALSVVGSGITSIVLPNAFGNNTTVNTITSVVESGSTGAILLVSVTISALSNNANQGIQFGAFTATALTSAVAYVSCVPPSSV